MCLNSRRVAITLALTAALTGLLTAGATTAAVAQSRSAAGNPAFQARAILSGSHLHHRFRKQAPHSSATRRSACLTT